ncbi:nuclear transport factor 2 family protein [Frondihabitans cladoniiphilus]|uniref:SnoaL-like domain-containing protein n=1 Tax=Frondihabitans cladoniiphilus TaxID=715785 RepID=A0ABP8WDK2_9MICO
MTAASATRTALETAQEFIRGVEAKDFEAVRATLSPHARQLFMHSSRTTTEAGAADLVADRAKGFCVADVDGRDEIMAYTQALFDKFTPLIWRDHTWTLSETGDAVYFSGRGDMIVTSNGRSYRNTYVTRFDVDDGRIVTMAEYANAFLYAGLRLTPNGAEFRALLRAIARMINPTLSATSGH